MNKSSFVAMMNVFDEYFNGEIFQALKTLGVAENAVTTLMDKMVDALESEIDPKNLAAKDDATYDCGSYIAEWLFGNTEFNEICKSAEDLYDYIIKKYSENNASH